MNWIKYSLIVFLLIVASTLFYVYYLWNKPHRDIQAEKAETISAVELYKKYSENEETANKLWLDKTLAVSGIIKEKLVNQTQIPVLMLDTEDPMGNISCTMDVSQKSKTDALKIGSKITVKGLCTGMLSDVVLVKCYLE